jgi:HEAT repeat protein
MRAMGCLISLIVLLVAGCAADHAARVAETRGLAKQRAGMPQLIERLSDPVPSVRAAAIDGIREGLRTGMFPPDAAATAIPGIAGRLDDGEESIRFAAAKALSGFRGAARDALPLLHTLADTADLAARDVYLRALTDIGGETHALAAVLTDRDTDKRAKAVIRLASMGADAAEAFRKFRKW